MTDTNSSLATRLPWPTQWPKPQRVRPAFTVAFLAIFGCVGVAAGVSIFLPGFADNRAYLLVLAAPLLFGASIAILLTRLRLRSRPSSTVRTGRVRDGGEQGLVIPYSPALAMTYVVMCVTTLALFVIITVITMVALASPGARTIGSVAQAVICLGFVIHLTWTLVDIMRGRLTIGAIVATPTGVYHRSWAFDSYLPWQEAVSVSAGQLDGQCITMAADTNTHPLVERRSRLWKQPEYTLAPHTTIRAMYLAVDPALAYHTLSFYHAHPDRRAELGTDAAVQRVRTGAILST